MLRNGKWTWRRTLTVMLLAVSAGSMGLSPGMVQAKGPVPGSLAGTVAVAELPVQGRELMTLIYQGGPFRYDRDGTVFGNRERILPARNRGYYREYTVKTPNERSRGARRIVCGGQRPVAPDACYYTDDHYASFRQIAQ